MYVIMYVSTVSLYIIALNCRSWWCYRSIYFSTFRDFFLLCSMLCEFGQFLGLYKNEWSTNEEKYPKILLRLSAAKQFKFIPNNVFLLPSFCLGLPASMCHTFDGKCLMNNNTKLLIHLCRNFSSKNHTITDSYPIGINCM